MKKGSELVSYRKYLVGRDFGMPSTVHLCPHGPLQPNFVISEITEGTQQWQDADAYDEEWPEILHLLAPGGG